LKKPLGYNADDRIDLHVHSTASDGSLTPNDILCLASRLQIRVISLTDHDTLDGYNQIDADLASDIQIVTGVEISVDIPSTFLISGGCHILGYGIRLDDPDLNHALSTLRKTRKDRNPKIIERLNQLGFPLGMTDVCQDIGDAQLGRPHIAQAMVEKGFVHSIDEAFDRYLGTGKPAYVNKYRLDVETSIRLIRHAGGAPVLAHPGLLKADSFEQIAALIHRFCQFGLAGLEVFYPEHTPEDMDRFTTLAHQTGLIMTGGTDFHGRLKPTIQLGLGEGDFFVPYTLYENLLSVIQKPHNNPIV
jgi:hypothetical protein